MKYFVRLASSPRMSRSMVRSDSGNRRMSVPGARTGSKRSAGFAAPTRPPQTAPAITTAPSARAPRRSNFFTSLLQLVDGPFGEEELWKSHLEVVRRVDHATVVALFPARLPEAIRLSRVRHDPELETEIIPRPQNTGVEHLFHVLRVDREVLGRIGVFEPEDRTAIHDEPAHALRRGPEEAQKPLPNPGEAHELGAPRDGRTRLRRLSRGAHRLDDGLRDIGLPQLQNLVGRQLVADAFGPDLVQEKLIRHPGLLELQDIHVRSGCGRQGFRGRGRRSGLGLHRRRRNWR